MPEQEGEQTDLLELLDADELRRLNLDVYFKP
jgi:hypothetical protein